jgi:hypothetical protein
LPEARVVWFALGEQPELTDFAEVHRNIADIIEMRLPEFPARPPHGMNKEANVAYLMNELDDASWKKALERNETKFLRKKEIGQILHMLCTTVSDQIRDMCTLSYDTPPTELRTFIEWFHNTFLPGLELLRSYTNDALLKLGTQNRMAVPQIDPGFVWKRPRALYKPLAPPPVPTAAPEVQEAPSPMQLCPPLSVAE